MELTDPVFVKPERYNALDRFALRFIRDERDLPFIHLILASTLVLVPAAAALYLVEKVTWWMAAAYWAVLLTQFLDRFILMLHNTSHRPLFKKQYGVLNNYIPWVLGPFFGETPDTYFAHHLGMHHAENNMYDDLSSTLRYQRDRLTHWLHYVGRFLTLGLFELAWYFYKRGRYDMMRKTLLGEGAWYAVMIALAFVNFEATMVVLVVPMLVTRCLMMAGNWGQHAFVDAADPENNYRNSITCINARYNRRAFNDGYHISHHLRANRHWTDHPGELIKYRQKYIDEEAIIFEGVDFFEVWLMLMLKRHRALAERMVDLGEPRTVEEKMELIKSRLKPVAPPAEAVQAEPVAA